MNPATLAVASRQLARALALSGAGCIPVYRQPRDANGVPEGAAAHVGCLYGQRYERGQTANLMIDIPGVIARRDMKRALCLASFGCASNVQKGDLLRFGGEWYEALDVIPEMGLIVDVILQERSAPDGV